MKPLGLVDGRLVDLNENVISMEDRGYQFGDGVYEVTRVYNGRCFQLRMHVDRLYRSLRELMIPAVYTYSELAEFHELLIKESGIKYGAIYLQITRGVAPRAHGFPENVVPKLTMSIRPTKVNTDNKENGIKVSLVPDERWLRCDIKSINLLGNILGKHRAQLAGSFEGIMVRDKYITEGTSSNFYVVKDDVVWTHPANNLILRGVTRTLLIEKIFKDLGITVIEKPFTPEFAKSADEAFISGTNAEILPVVTIDGQPVRDGKVGKITRQVIEAYEALIDEECGRKR